MVHSSPIFTAGLRIVNTLLCGLYVVSNVTFPTPVKNIYHEY